MGKVGGQDTQIGKDAGSIQSGSISQRCVVFQDGGYPLTDVFPDGIHLIDDGRADMTWKNEAMNQDGRDKTDAGFFSTGDCHIRDVLHIDEIDVTQYTEDDDRYGKTGDGVDVGVRRPFQHRKVHADADPESDQKAQQYSVVHERD